MKSISLAFFLFALLAGSVHAAVACCSAVDNSHGATHGAVSHQAAAASEPASGHDMHSHQGHMSTPQQMADANGNEDCKAHPACGLCGMSREKFGQSRMLTEYEDGTVFAACSLHCAAIDLAQNLDKGVARIMVADYTTRNLVDADQATWVIGGSKPGIMSKRGKWAFARREDAEAFAKDNGGTLARLDEAIKASFEDMHEDTKMIRERRKAMRIRQG